MGSRSYLTGDGAVHGEQTKMAVELAIDKGATRENLREVLRTIDLEGVTGINKFNGAGDVEGKSFFVNMIKNDDWAHPDFGLDTMGLR